ncbi:class II aldolase/adducin family protein [Paenibacillus polysaccharolyticus]|uniref:L-fuculose-phosphate aldolase n=2 Tax=Paenibacillus TaxID=44249 RepID=A0A1G5LMT2_9BACL|nr:MULTISPECIES: class II aldolase/adducin family protein [Paenibacillus]MDP9697518.1 L-fuculose-phosphate aldolase [Paenibacillus intestini]MBY0204976.1 class II aldolase/adducin family protein [Paenibacillus cucumis (ex Kampfer et al. 2016)]MCM3132792.1 class II aldolase/adducin family protein [Paenibacillus polysaccharolyticus]MCP1133568.1 class II aldolase/adducin family protein [Paenibacillus polysaccharolyticus]SCZ13540.1 L-fuculose-phosphate aldolase [Paenibacillus polysaccharolyticus]
MSEQQIREELTKYARKAVTQGLVVGPGGNISARSGNTMLLSPSGFALEELEPDEWIAIDMETGETQAGASRPSSEVLMHLFSYRANPDIQAIVHTHPAYTIALSLVFDHLPHLFPDQSALVGDIGFVPYVLPTTKLLADAVAAKVTEHSALILVNHGLVTTGKNLREAYYRTQVVEESAKVYMIAKAAGEPKILTDAEYKEIQSLESEAYRVQLLQQLKS